MTARPLACPGHRPGWKTPRKIFGWDVSGWLRCAPVLRPACALPLWGGWGRTCPAHRIKEDHRMVMTGKRSDRRVDAATSGADPSLEDANMADAPWWELSGYQRHAACLVAAREGDRQALDALVHDLAPLVWHVARAQGIERTQAEDVVQTVWLTLLRNLHSVAEPRALARWLITTTRREAVRVARSVENEQPLVDDVLDRLRAQDGLPEQEALQRDRNIALWTAFRQLDATLPGAPATHRAGRPGRVQRGRGNTADATRQHRPNAQPMPYRVA